MKKTVLILAVLALAPAAAVSADTIPLYSQAGLSWTALVNLPGVGAAGTTGTTVAITPHYAWDSNDASSIWISYAATGYGDGVLAPTHNAGADRVPIVSIFQTFTGGGPLNLKVWADDTAFVYIDNAPLWNSHTWAQSTCETYAISCAPLNYGAIATDLAYGTHTLRFDVFQIGTGTNTTSNPFGVKWEGTASVPEPTSMLLLGTGLIGLVGAARRRVKK